MSKRRYIHLSYMSLLLVFFTLMWDYGFARASTLNDLLREVKIIAYPAHGNPVDSTVSAAIKNSFSPDARVVKYSGESSSPGNHVFRIYVVNEYKSLNDQLRKLALSKGSWMYFRIDDDGSGELVTSSSNLMYAMFYQIELWRDNSADEFKKGIVVRPAFEWLRNYSDFLVGTRRYSRSFDANAYVKQAACQGFTHITVNGLGVPHPFEEGPPGDSYSEFYDYTPDLDQFFSTPLLKGYYPAWYLEANLNFMRRIAETARSYGLKPGVVICSPRTMPDEFWNRYPFLRGARVDHPRESYKPRYTLTLEHPVVKQHYRDLIDSLMKAIPDISFIEIWSNDSGSGFEFANRLYPGRNGGPYLVREWNDDDTIARKVAENVLSYYHLILDEARKFNPDLRLIVDLGSFTPLELKYIIPGLGHGIDVGDWSGQSKDQIAFNERMQKQWEAYGAATHYTINATNDNSVGVVSPVFVYNQLVHAYKDKSNFLLTETTPWSIDPYDINGAVLREFQFDPEKSIMNILHEVAERWAGKEYSSKLVSVWLTADSSVEGFPEGIPYQTFGFPWYKLSTRPFVPNISAIPDSERAYYERFMLTTFNNPTRIDLNNDMLWNFLTVQQAGEKRAEFDTKTIPPIERAIEMTERVLQSMNGSSSQAKKVFTDLLVRLRVYRNYIMTLRDVVGWIEGVHGYIEARTEAERSSYLTKVRSVVESEIKNTEDLLDLWFHSPVEFMPVSTIGENMHIYGDDFGQLLMKKISLMVKHKNDIPYIDPNFMWHMPHHYPPSLN